MYEQDNDAAGERWFGVQEAASYLGMHRATLFRALKNGLITADRTTPRGHARFRRETLDACRQALAHQAATGQDHIYLPVRVMAQLTNMLATLSGDSGAILDQTLRLLCPPHGSFDMVCVGVRVPSETDPYALRFPARYGFPDRLMAAYEYLRPYEEFPVNLVLRTGEPEIYDDIHNHPFPNSTAMRALTQSEIISYAVLPIITGAGASRRTIGVLAVCLHSPHKFSSQERIFLAGVADALSVCIAQGFLSSCPIHHDDAAVLTPEKALDIASYLLDLALARTRCPSVFPPTAMPVESLCNILVEQSYALAVWVDGYPPGPCGNTPVTLEDDGLLRQYQGYLQSLVHRTRVADGPKREQWHNQVTAVALPVPLATGERGAVGAVWRGVREDVAAEKILLSTLANACSLVSEYPVSERN